MKTILLATVFSILGTSVTTGVTSEKSVYICTGPMSKKYHSRSNCKGLRNCSEDVLKVSLEKAISLGRTPYKVCHNNNASNKSGRRSRIKVRYKDGREGSAYYTACIRNPYGFAKAYPGSKILVTGKDGKQRWVNVGREEVEGRINKWHRLVTFVKE